MAEAAARGASTETGVIVKLLRAADARAEDVLAADGYIFVTPENLASMAGMMKDFFDRTYYAALDRIAGRAYATLICAGSDGANAVRQIDRICTGLKLKKVAEPVVAVKTNTADKLEQARELALALVGEGRVVAREFRGTGRGRPGHAPRAAGR